MAQRPRSRCGSMHKVDGSNVSSSVVGECGLAKSPVGKFTHLTWAEPLSVPAHGPASRAIADL